MINQSNAIIAGGLALSPEAKKLNLSELVTDAISSLKDASYDLKGYNKDDVTTRLPVVTADNEHEIIVDEVSTRIANGVRSNLEFISNTVKPIITGLENRLYDKLNFDNFYDIIARILNISFVNISPSIFNSPLYPTELNKTLAQSDHIAKSDLAIGDWPTVTGAELSKMIYLNIPELSHIFSDEELLSSVWNTVFVYKDLGYIVDNYEGCFDNNNLYYNDLKASFKNLNSLIAGTLILTYLINNDTPFEGVTNVSLDQYRAGLSYLQGIFNDVLVRLKKTWEIKAKAGICFSDENIEYKPYSLIYGMKEDECPLMLSGRITVSYSKDVLEFFDNNPNYNLTETVIGLLYLKYVAHQHVNDIITNADDIKNGYITYLNNVSSVGISYHNNTVEKTVKDYFREVIEEKELVGYYTERNNGVVDYLAMYNDIREVVDFVSIFTPTFFEDKETKNKIMGTMIPTAVCRSLNAPIAAEITQLIMYDRADTESNKRKELNKAISRIVVSNLFKTF